VVLSGFSSRACPASQETALTPTFTGGELPLKQNIMRKYRETGKKKYWERLFGSKVPLYLLYAIQRE